jgi:hypothetical protein
MPDEIEKSWCEHGTRAMSLEFERSRALAVRAFVALEPRNGGAVWNFAERRPSPTSA